MINPAITVDELGNIYAITIDAASGAMIVTPVPDVTVTRIAPQKEPARSEKRPQ